MTLHFQTPDYKCPKCKVKFFPYKIGIKCPNCDAKIPKADIKKYSETIRQIADSMSFNKVNYGSCMPITWGIHNFMEHIQYLNFQIFYFMEEEKPKNQETFLLDIIENKYAWDDQPYLKKHMKDITIDVLKIYRDEKFSEIVFVDPESELARFIEKKPNMTLEEASKIFESWIDYVEIADKMRVIFYEIPESFLPYPKKIIEEALLVIVNRCTEDGDKKAIDYIQATIHNNLNSHKEDERAIESMRKTLNDELEDPKLKKATLKRLEECRDFWKKNK